MQRKMSARLMTVALLSGVLVFFVPALASSENHKPNASYDLPEYLPAADRTALVKAGWNAALVATFEEKIYRRYRKAYAFFLIPNALPEEHLLMLAEYTNVITGNQVDPYLIAAIHSNEVFLNVEIGGYTFYPREEPGTRVLDDTTYADWQRAAFNKIIVDIKRNPRFKNVQPSHPVVSRNGAMGYFQVLPTVWLHYKKRVLETLNLAAASPYELVPSMFAVNFILTDMARYLKHSPDEVRLGGNPLYFAQLATAYNAGAVNTRGSVSPYGFAVYETAKRMREKRRLELAVRGISP